MKQNSQWLSQVRTLSNSAECTSTPVAPPTASPPPRASPAPTPHLDRQGGVVDELAPFEQVAGHLAVDGDDLVALDQADARPAIRARRRRHGGQTQATQSTDLVRSTVRPLVGPGGCERSHGYAGRCPWTRSSLAAPRGFCAGVEMAIKALAWMVRAFEPPVYCYHEIVHNQQVVDRFATWAWCSSTTSRRCRRGARSCSPPTGPPPRWWRPPRAGSYVVNAVAPLVTKVHHEVKVRSGKGYRIVYVGHEGHEEAVGTMAVAPDAIDLVGLGRRCRRLAGHRPAGSPAGADHALAHDWAAVAERTAERFPGLWRPGRSDLCFATTNRQSALPRSRPVGRGRHRVGQLLQHLRPGEAGPRVRRTRVYRINAAEELPDDLTGTVGVGKGLGARGPGRCGDRPAGPGGRGGGGQDHRRGRVLPAAARAARPPQRRRRPGHVRVRRLRAGPSSRSTTASCAPAMSWPCWPEPGGGEILVVLPSWLRRSAWPARGGQPPPHGAATTTTRDPGGPGQLRRRPGGNDFADAGNVDVERREADQPPGGAGGAPGRRIVARPPLDGDVERGARGRSPSSPISSASCPGASRSIGK